MEPQLIVSGYGHSALSRAGVGTPIVARRMRQAEQGPANGRQADTEYADKDAESPEAEAYIICRSCHNAITRNEERFSMQGAHRHTFANPQGLIFEIGCFRSAVGCGYAGRASDEFTWFSGYQWRAGFCKNCLTHLGWLFTSTGGDAFHGLILERLIEPD